MISFAVIDFEPKFNVFHELMFTHGVLNKKNFINEAEVNGKKFHIISIPVCGEHIINERKLTKFLSNFIGYIKALGVRRVILSNRASKIKLLEEKLSEEFYIYNGNSIIIYRFSDILKKYIIRNEKNEKCLVFIADDFDRFYECFLRVFKSYRIASVITDNKDKFADFSESIFDDYGILLEIGDMKNLVYNRENIYINIDNSVCNIKADINLEKISVIFSRCECFKEIYKYFKRIDQKTVEFLIYVLYDNVSNSSISEFFDNFQLRIVNIHKK